MILCCYCLLCKYKCNKKAFYNAKEKKNELSQTKLLVIKFKLQSCLKNKGSKCRVEMSYIKCQDSKLQDKKPDLIPDKPYSGLGLTELI